MRRREFITLVGSAAAVPVAARAQQPSIPIVGFVSSGSLDGSARYAAAFSKGFSEIGYVEGQDLTVEYHWLGGQNDRLPSLMADLVRRRVAVIATAGGPTTLAAKAATRNNPYRIRRQRRPGEARPSCQPSAARGQRDWHQFFDD